MHGLLTLLFILAENVAPKGKKGSGKNPNKKKGKKPKRAVKNYSWQSDDEDDLIGAINTTVLTPAHTAHVANAVTSPTVNRCRIVSLETIHSKVPVRAPSPTPEPKTENPFALLALEDSDVACSPTPAAPSPKSFMGDNLLDALEIIGDLQYIECLDFGVNWAPAPVVAALVPENVAARQEQVGEEKPVGLLVKAFRIFKKAAVKVVAAAVAISRVVRSWF